MPETSSGCFDSTQIPVCLWVLAKNKNADAKFGTLIDRVHRELTDAITGTCHTPHGAVGVPPSGGSSTKDRLKAGLQPCADVPGFCKSDS